MNKRVLYIVVSICIHFFGTRIYAEECIVPTLRNLFLESRTVHQTSRQEVVDTFKKIEDSLSKEDYNWFLSQYFLDRDVTSVHADRELAKLAHIWDGEKVFFTRLSPFGNFKQAFTTFVLDEQSKLSSQSLKEFHSILMKPHRFLGGIGGLSKVQVGKFRETEKISFYASKEQKQLVDMGINTSLGSRIYKNNRMSIDYVTKEKIKANPELLAYIKTQNPKLFDNLINNSPECSFRDLMEEYVNYELINYQKKITEIPLENVYDRIKTHAELVHRLVSIHPFRDGNGRTTRFLLNKLLIDDGLAPVLLRDDNDVLRSIDSYAERVLDGVKAGETYLDEVQKRIALGLDIKKSHSTQLARLPKEIYLKPGADSKYKLPFDVDSRDFIAFVENLKRTKQLPNDEIKLLRMYVSHVKKWSTVFEKEDFQEPYQIKMIDQDFADMHNMKLSTKPELWKYKKEQYYDDSSIYRGLATHSTYEDEELLSFFTSTQSIYLSMNSGRTNVLSKGLKNKVREDFNKFNELTNNPDEMFQYVADHMNAEGKYGVSPFLSTSKNYNTANRFSKGYLTGKSNILSMKGQLVVSSYKPKVGMVDLNRLRLIHGKVGKGTFVSKYPRQEEVSVAGSLDPDMINKIEFRDVVVKSVDQNTGEAIAGTTEVNLVRTLIRDPEKPYLIKLIKQDGQKKVLTEQTYDLRELEKKKPTEK